MILLVINFESKIARVLNSFLEESFLDCCSFWHFKFGREKWFLPVCPSDSLAHVAGAGLVQLLLHVVVEGGHGLLYVA